MKTLHCTPYDCNLSVFPTLSSHYNVVTYCFVFALLSYYFQHIYDFLRSKAGGRLHVVSFSVLHSIENQCDIYIYIVVLFFFSS